MWYRIARRVLAAHDDDYDLSALNADNPEEQAVVRADEAMRALHSGEEWTSPLGAVRVNPQSFPSFEEWRGDDSQAFYADDFQRVIWDVEDFIKRMRDGGSTAVGRVVPMTQQIQTMGELGVIPSQVAEQASSEISQVLDVVGQMVEPVKRGFEAVLAKEAKLHQVRQEDQKYLEMNSRDPRVDMGDELEALIANESAMSVEMSKQVAGAANRISQIVSRVAEQTIDPLYRQNLIELMVKNNLGGQYLKGQAQAYYKKRTDDQDREQYDYERSLRGL